MYTYMYPVRSIKLPVWIRGLSSLSTGKSRVAFHLHSALVAPDDVIKRIVKVVSCRCPSQSLAPVHLTNQLTIIGLPVPWKVQLKAVQHLRIVDWISFLSREPVQLVSCCLVIKPHWSTTCLILAITLDNLPEPTLLPRHRLENTSISPSLAPLQW